MARSRTATKPQRVPNTATGDVIFRQGFLSLAEQKEVYDKVMQIEPGFYVPVLRNGSKMNLMMNCFGLDWSARTYEYSKIRDIDGKETAPMPDFLQAIARRALNDTNYWRGPGEVPPYDICLADLYREGEGKLGVHRDNSEREQSLRIGYPVISLSIGASAIFTIGGLERDDPQQQYQLDSGDLVMFGRSMRLAYHGITRVLRGTTPSELGFAEPGRLSLSLRIY